jgi:hypothetical protein
MDNVKVNKLELACELAEHRLKEIMHEDEIYDYHGENDVRYTEEAQDIFNHYYAEYEDIINQVKIKQR